MTNFIISLISLLQGVYTENDSHIVIEDTIGG